MAYTGPVEVPEFGVTVEPEDAAQFIIEDQYVLAGDDGNDQRTDAMQALGEQVIARLLSTPLPEPADLARDLGAGRVLVAVPSTDEQALSRLRGHGFEAMPYPPESGQLAFELSRGNAEKVSRLGETNLGELMTPRPGTLGGPESWEEGA